MITIKHIFSENGWQPLIPAAAENSFIHAPKSMDKKGLFTNLSFDNVIIRSVITLLLPLAIFLVNKNLVIYTVPVMAYLFTSAILRFCAGKYVWDYFMKRTPPVSLASYPEKVKYPAESLSSLTNF